MYELNEELIVELTYVYQEAVGNTGYDALEMVVHEMAHLVDITGSPVLPEDGRVGRFIDERVGRLIDKALGHSQRAMDCNEVRASVVTKKVFEMLGFLESNEQFGINRWSKVIFDSMRANIAYITGDDLKNLWRKMEHSTRTTKQACVIIDHLQMWGVVTQPET